MASDEKRRRGKVTINRGTDEEYFGEYHVIEWPGGFFALVGAGDRRYGPDPKRTELLARRIARVQSPEPTP